MASRLIHLSIADAILREFAISDEGRFRLGSILPDAKNDSHLRAAPHYQVYLTDDTLTYDLDLFRSQFGERMKRDSLYLGYYLHLIQDMVYRQYMYALPHWDARIWENVLQLHSDYRKINRYLIDSRGIENGIIAPADFEREDINLLFEFDLNVFLSELQKDFEIIQEGEYHHFTPEMADEFIERAIDACRREMIAIEKGLPLLEQGSMVWGRE
ncbi:MAG: hypothetical protein IKV79_00615 [Oscillospiraceae bacterium]|nr:hypothetical protein [Oscillospiraceae bacterium]